MAVPRLLVVTGPPGAGKTTIALALRERLGLPLIAKDTLKETLGAELGIVERVESQRLGSSVFELMRVIVHELLTAGVSAICEGNFTPGTRLFHDLPAVRITQLHVFAAADVLRGRLLERDTHRHPVHYDRDAADEIHERARRGEWDVLPLDGELVRIDTSIWPDLTAVLDSVTGAFPGGRAGNAGDGR